MTGGPGVRLLLSIGFGFSPFNAIRKGAPQKSTPCNTSTARFADSRSWKFANPALPSLFPLSGMIEALRTPPTR